MGHSSSWSAVLLLDMCFLCVHPHSFIPRTWLCVAGTGVDGGKEREKRFPHLHRTRLYIGESSVQ